MSPSTRFRVLPVFVLAITLTACVHSGFTRTTSLRPPARAEGCYIDVVLDGRPDYAYVVLGRLTTDAVVPGIFALGESENAAMDRLRRKACEVGAHAIFAVETSSEGQWTGEGMSRSTRGSAVAAVYVDEQGRLLAPPTGPVDRVALPVRR